MYLARIAQHTRYIDVECLCSWTGGCVVDDICRMISLNKPYFCRLLTDVTWSVDTMHMIHGMFNWSDYRWKWNLRANVHDENWPNRQSFSIRGFGFDAFYHNIWWGQQETSLLLWLAYGHHWWMVSQWMLAARLEQWLGCNEWRNLLFQENWGPDESFCGLWPNVGLLTHINGLKSKPNRNKNRFERDHNCSVLWFGFNVEVIELIFAMITITSYGKHQHWSQYPASHEHKFQTWLWYQCINYIRDPATKIHWSYILMDYVII